jgi:hypothetical protein
MSNNKQQTPVTPREKAVELVHKFGMENQYYERAKQCALIAVDELIESHLLLTTTHEREPSIRCKRYWIEVKKEIEKL